jgi:hypothetical protein
MASKQMNQEDATSQALCSEDGITFKAPESNGMVAKRPKLSSLEPNFLVPLEKDNTHQPIVVNGDPMHIATHDESGVEPPVPEGISLEGALIAAVTEITGYIKTLTISSAELRSVKCDVSPDVHAQCMERTKTTDDAAARIIQSATSLVRAINKI